MPSQPIDVGIGDRLRPEKRILFWMDTCCIPVGPAFRSARRKAIDSKAVATFRVQARRTDALYWHQLLMSWNHSPKVLKGVMVQCSFYLNSSSIPSYASAGSSCLGGPEFELVSSE